MNTRTYTPTFGLSVGMVIVFGLLALVVFYAASNMNMTVVHPVTTGLNRVTAAGYGHYANCRPDEGWTVFEDDETQAFPRMPTSCNQEGFNSFKEQMRDRIIRAFGEDFFNKLVP